MAGILYVYDVKVHFIGWCDNHVLQKYTQVNATGPQLREVNIGSSDGLVPLGNKPLPGPMLTQICFCHMASPSYNG